MIATCKAPSLWLAPGVYESRLTEHKLIDTASGILGVTIAELKSKSRKTEIRLPRQVIMRLLRLNFPALSLVIIGEMFNHDHCTVMHAISAIQDRLDTEYDFKIWYNDIANQTGKKNFLHKPLLK